MGAFTTQLPPDRKQWSLLILKQFYREHNYINPQIIKVILKDGAGVNDAGGVYFSKDGVSFISPIIVHDGQLASFDTFITASGEIFPLTAHSFNQVMLSHITNEGVPVRKKTVMTSTVVRNDRVEGYGLEEPIVKTGAAIATGLGKARSLDENGRLEWPGNTDIEAAVASIDLTLEKKAGSEMIKVADVYRYGDLYDVTVKGEGKHTALTRAQAKTLLSLCGMQLEKLGERESGTLSSAGEVSVELLGKPREDPDLTKEAAYFFFKDMRIEEVSPISAAYSIEKIAELKQNDLVGFFGSVGSGNSFFTEPIIVVSGSENEFDGIAMSSTETFHFKRAELLRYPVKKDDTVFIPKDWSMARVKPSDRSILKEAALEPENLVKLAYKNRIWVLDDSKSRKTLYTEGEVDAVLAEKGLSPEQMDLVKSAAVSEGMSRFLVKSLSKNMEKKAEVKVDAQKLEEIRACALNAAVKLAADTNVSDATVRQILQLPVITKKENKDFVAYVQQLMEIKSYLAQYLLRYRIDSQVPNEDLVETIKDLINNIEQLEAAVYGE